MSAIERFTDMVAEFDRLNTGLFTCQRVLARCLVAELTALTRKAELAEAVIAAAQGVVDDCVPMGDDDFKELQAALTAYRSAP